MILRNGQPFSIDSPWSDEHGTQYPANWFRLASQTDRTAKGFSEIPDPVQQDSRYYYNNSDGTSIEKPIEQLRQVFTQQIADTRWNKETSGIIYSTANAVFATDSQSRVNYIGALNQAMANANYSVIWKAKTTDDMQPKSVFVTLTSNDVISIVNSGVDYVTKCFVTEQFLSNQVAAANTLGTLMTIDVANSWPTRTY